MGGLGTRLGELGKTAPKPLLPVAGAPFAEVLIEEARRRGFRRFVLLAGHKAEVARAFVQEREIERRFSCRVEISVEPTPFGTGGAVVHALPLLDDEFLLLNGDTWFDFNWRDLTARGRACGAEAALSLRRVEKPDRYETVERSGSRVARIHPRREGLESAAINGGVYYMTRRAFDKLARPSSLENDLLPALAARDVLAGFEYSGFFIDIGLPETLAAADELVPKARRRPAVFLDRDGVLNLDHGYAHRPDQIDWVPGAQAAVKRINEAGYYAFVVTNQAGVAKGHYPEEAIGRLHDWMAAQLADVGAAIDDWRYCPHHPEGVVEAYRQAHDWRKPEPGMIKDLLECWPVERAGSFLIGDKDSDIEAAQAAGLTGHLFEGGDLSRFLDELERRGVFRSRAG
jgi:D-glycero-D-manno-heptose 1,7-bisphosphate phosphatase